MLRRLPPSEAFSFWTHVVGAILGVAGLVALLLVANTTIARIGAVVYGLSLVLLFTSSSLHHAYHDLAARGRSALRRLDHVAIYLLIAGTYTPVCLVGVPREWGIPILVVIWTMALAGCVAKIFFPFTPRWATVALYMLMGWMAVLAVKPILDTFSWELVALLAGGGLVYTLGAIVYATKRPNLVPRLVGFHGLWHLFVLAGAAMHYAFVFAILST